MTNQERFSYLYRQYTNRSCTRQEMEEFFVCIQDPAWKSLLEETALHHIEELKPGAVLPSIDWEHMYGQITGKGKVSDHENNLPTSRSTSLLVQLKRWKAIAAILLVATIAGLGYIFFTKERKQEKEIATVQKVKVMAGNNKATLTLSDGRRVVLDSSSQSLLAKELPGMIAVLNNSRLQYRPDSSITFSRLPEMNTITTPNGGEYDILLSDGTRVWLNAASSITFPSVFAGHERKVIATGEVYFEVAANPSKPFKVAVNDATIEVLGTDFNINAYHDESLVKTTLLRGSVRVSKGGSSRILKPGQQAQFSNNNNLIQLIEEADTEEAIAWKNGSFDFNGQPITGVMNQIARWYNMEIVYEGKKPEGHFSGMLNRNTDLATVLKSIELSGIHFRIESVPAGNQPGKLIVLP